VTLSKRVDVAVSHQLARWEEARRATHVLPCVAIANLPGAGGEEVGERLADLLGYGHFGREIVDDIAKRRGVSQDLLHGLDDRMRSMIERYVTDFFQNRRFREHEYFQEVARTIATLGRRGMAVVVGRGAAFLLGPEVALRVGLVAPLAVRVERVARERSLSKERAETLVKEEDGRRTAFVEHHFGVRADDPLSFDLVLNTSVFDYETAARVIVDVLGKRFPDVRRWG
jgi:cytidylate kinase